MSKKLQKKLQDYLNKIKQKKPHPQKQLTKILSNFKLPKTPSFSLEISRRNKSAPLNGVNNKIDDAATLADIDQFLFENFKSLFFDEETENSVNKRISDAKNKHEQKFSSYLFESPHADLCGDSSRFFVKPENLSSLMEDTLSLTNSDEAESSNSNSSTTASISKEIINIITNHNHDHDQNLPHNCVALLSYSPTPYDDFRRSMQELVESKFGSIENNQRKIDWDFMEEILVSYLSLNEKKYHKFILIAFVDMITAMRQNSDAAPAKPCSVRTVRNMI